MIPGILDLDYIGEIKVVKSAQIMFDQEHIPGRGARQRSPRRSPGCRRLKINCKVCQRQSRVRRFIQRAAVEP